MKESHNYNPRSNYILSSTYSKIVSINKIEIYIDVSIVKNYSTNYHKGEWIKQIIYNIYHILSIILSMRSQGTNLIICVPPWWHSPNLLLHGK